MIKKDKAFTLVELLVVVAVLALLASIVFSNLTGAREQAKISNALSFQSNMHNLLGADLVGWWNFDDEDNRYKDLSGYGNNGSCTSCPTLVDGVPGITGNALEFNGNGNRVDFNTITLHDFTISLWTNPYVLADYATIISDGGTNNAFKAWTDDTMRFRVEGTYRIRSSIPLEINVFTNIIITRNQGNFAMYFNGNNVSAATSVDVSAWPFS
ncbi:MAG: LamG-like jellyroll fold domain-containing protein, partial [Minisyncoccales bacterium]